jgi:hemolysin III
MSSYFMTERTQSLGEEIANSVSHGLGLLAALGAAPILVAGARDLNDARFAGAIVFAVTMVMLYLTSTLFHALPAGKAKRVLLRLDYCAIFLFIAGSYTPFALGALQGVWEWTLFGLVWLLAVAGVILKSTGMLSHPVVSTALYLGLGWLVLVAAVPLLDRMPIQGLAWLVAGGLAYTAGVVFFALDSRIRYAHAIWHGFVVTGTGCHFFAVLGNAV